VPPGVDNMALALQVSDPLYLLEGLLIDPQGMQLSVEPNVDAAGNPVGSMQLERARPQPGRWRFVLLLNYFTSGNQTSLPFTAQIGLDTSQVAVGAPGLPNDADVRLSAGAAPLAVPINITNNSGLSKAYFADARLRGLTTMAFATFAACGPQGQPPLTQLPFACFVTFLPTQVHSARFVAQAGAPITMDVAGNTGYLFGFTGAPDVAARPLGPNIVAASLTEPEVPWGQWIMFPSLVGPFGPGGAPTTSVTTSVSAQLKPFDASISSDAGDLWADVALGTSTFTGGLVLAPGQTGTINVTIAPSPAQVGKVVSGVLYIDTFNSTVQTGDEVKAIPYRYTVAP
jgi:hypothetical protein